MSGDLTDEQIHEWYRKSREAAGLGLTIEDPDVLLKIARIMDLHEKEVAAREAAARQAKRRRRKETR